MTAHVAAITFTLMVYLLLGAAYYGWGRAASVVLGTSRQRPESAVMPVWLGWAFTLFIFQVLHFFLPVTAYMVIPVLALGAVFSVNPIISALRRFSEERPALAIMAVAVTLGLALSAWLASKAMLPPVNYDSGMYHFNAIRWINTHPVLPGLGNLHGRLAFNQSFFTYAAAIDFYPFFGHGRSLANSFLLLLVVATASPPLRSIARRPSLARGHLFSYAPGLFMLPVVAYLALSSDGIASPTPDLASTLLQLAMLTMLAHGMAEWMEGQRDQDYRVMVLVVLAATAVTVKLSNMAFSAAIIGFALAYAWQGPRPLIGCAVRVLLPAASLVLVWGLRGFMLSGAPLYPSTIGYMPVEWAVPRDTVADTANWVYSWARQPGTHWSNVLGRWDWLGPWALRVSRNSTGVVIPLALSAAFCAIALATGFFRKVRRPRPLEWAILLPSVVGLIYWFFTAPDPRFAHALFWLLSLSSAVLMLSSLRLFLGRNGFIAAFCIVFIAANIVFAGYFLRHSRAIMAVSTAGWHPVRAVPLLQKRTASGLAVYTPARGDQCWDSPLPCTPYFNPDLRLRVPGKPGSGFALGTDRGNSE